MDIEHGGFDVETMTNVFRTIDAYGSASVARLPYADTIWIKRTLDAGEYPPLGERGYGYSRANLHGIDFSEYIRTANEEISLVMQIEHRDGIDAILDVPGVDGAFIGPLDLSGSYGKTAQLDCPEMIDALSRFRQACSAHRKAAGMHIVHPARENIKAAISDGYSMIALGLDNIFLAGAARDALNQARALSSRE